MTIPALRASALVTAVAAFVSLASACTSTNSSTGPSATTADYCSELQSYVSKCAITDACSVQIAQNCDKFTASLSAGAIAAYASCYQNLGCGDAGLAQGTACFNAAQTKITPTAAQSTLAQHYCAVCTTAGQTAAQCETAFYAPTNAEAGTSGFANLLLDFNDSLALSVDAQCAAKLASEAGAVDCFDAFLVCADPLIQAALYEPAACTAQPAQ